MADAPSGAAFLKQKVAGIPVWALVGAVGAGAAAFIWYQNSHKSSSSSASAMNPNSPGAAAGTATSAPPIYVSTPPSTASSDTSSTSSSTTGPPTPTWQNGDPSGDFVWQSTGQNAPQGFPTNQAMPGPNSPTTGNTKAYPGFGPYSWEWSPVPQGNDPSGNPWTAQSYAAALNSAGMGGMIGMGGMPGPSETPWHRFTQKNHVPSYWASGMGGGNLNKLSSELGVPWQRLWSLNPQLHGRGGAHRPNEPVHVA